MTNVALQVGMTYRFKCFTKEIDQQYRHKLLAMGLLPGSLFEVVRFAPLGGPVELKLNGFSLSLRRQQFRAMSLEVIN